MDFTAFESLISERGGSPNFAAIKKGNVIEYVQPGLGRTSTGRVVDKGTSSGKEYVVIVDDNNEQRIKVFMQDVGNTYEDETLMG
jgi:hypothetical protein